MTNTYRTRNWQLFLRKRIARLYDKGWDPASIAFNYGIPMSIVEYHMRFIRKRQTEH